MSISNPFDEPSYTDNRGQRHLASNLRRAITDYEIAYELATITEEPMDAEHADDLRKILLSETQEARLSLPPSESRTEPTQLEQVLAKATEVLGKLRVLVPVHSRNEPDVNQDSQTAPAPGGGDGPAIAPNDQLTCNARTEQITQLTNNDDHDDLSIYEIGVSVSRQNSNHSGLSNLSTGSHVQLTRSQIAREREIFNSHQRIQELEDALHTEKKRREEVVATMKRRWDRDMEKAKLDLKEIYSTEIAELKDTIVDQDRRITLLQQNRPIPPPPAPLPPVLTYREVESEYTPEELDRRLRILEHGQMIRLSGNSNTQRDSESTVPKTSSNQVPVTITRTTTTATPGTSASQPNTSVRTNASVTLPTHTVSTPILAIPSTSQPAQHVASSDNSATQSLIDIQLKSHAFSVLIQRRPKYKYNGDKKMDFESFLHQFTSMTNVPGADDSMKLAELGHWFSGQAALVTERFLTETDATEALRDAVKALKSEFGKKRLTAKQMLTEVLTGDKLLEREYQSVKTFLLQLEKIYQVAKDTKRSQSFDLPEVINEILRSKLPHLAQKWAKLVSEHDDNANGDETPPVTFTQFLTFAKKQNNIAQTLGDILKPPETNRTQAKPQVRIAASHQGNTIPKRPCTRPSTTPNSTPSNPWECMECPFCPGQRHLPSRCGKWARLSFPDKANLVRDNFICIKCLKKGHSASTCSSLTKCSVCDGGHADLMHGVKIIRPNSS